MADITFTDHAGLAVPEREALAAGPGRLRGLDEIFSWGRSQTPPIHPADVVKQDELTHDVLVPLSSTRWLVYGTT